MIDYCIGKINICNFLYPACDINATGRPFLTYKEFCTASQYLHNTLSYVLLYGTFRQTA